MFLNYHLPSKDCLNEQQSRWRRIMHCGLQSLTICVQMIVLTEVKHVLINNVTYANEPAKFIVDLKKRFCFTVVPHCLC